MSKAINQSCIAPKILDKVKQLNILNPTFKVVCKQTNKQKKIPFSAQDPEHQMYSLYTVLACPNSWQGNNNMPAAKLISDLPWGGRGRESCMQALSSDVCSLGP